MAEVKSTKKEQPMLDPIAYRSDYPEENIIWWDKATVENTDKYQWEGTRNVYNPYDPEMTIDKLDPNYQYWQPAKDINHIDDSYITKRNDQIASALYNEWKITREEVIAFLQWQNNWYNSTEQDRATTIENVWNRIGHYGAENWNKEDKNAEVDNSGVDRMRNDMDRNKDGTIYGKTSPEEWKATGWIDTLKDANSVDNIMNEARIANVKTLLWMPVEQIAAALESNTIPWDMQAIVDYRDYYPELYAQVEEARKKLRWQEVINAITTWDTIPTETSGTSAANNDIATFAADNANYSNSMQDILTDIHQTLTSSKSASSASETMDSIEQDMVDLTNRLKNLRKEANTVFKWDAPDYLVNAYVNNKTQEIQNELSKLSERYKYASARYDKEVANAQWEKEYSLKERQVAVQESAQQLAIDKWKAENKVKDKSDTTTTNSNPTTTTSVYWKELPLTTKNRNQIWWIVDNLVKMLENWELGNAQCAKWIQTYYLPQLWISFGTLSKWNEKLWIMNEDRSYTPQKWDLIILASWTAPANWHMWIVVWITANGKIQYLDWNWLAWKNAEEPALREIDPSSAKIQGYYNATKWQNESEWWVEDYDIEIYGAWYDPQLWFNPERKEIYQKINDGTWTGTFPEKAADYMWIEVTELWRQADNYAKALKNWYIAYEYPNRDTSNFWYLEWKEQIYANIANTLKNKKQIPWTQKNLYIEQLGLNPKDPNAWNIITNEMNAYEKANDTKFDEVKDLLQAAEYIMSQDANWWQRVNASMKIWMYGEWASWRTAYKFIKANTALNALADSKWKWATLTPMSDKDFQAIKEASTLINASDDTDNFRLNVNNYYNTLREVAWLPQLTQSQLDDMWDTESNPKSSWENYLVLWYATDWDGRYRYHKWKKVYEWSSWYEAETPLFFRTYKGSWWWTIDDEIDNFFDSIGNE